MAQCFRLLALPLLMCTFDLPTGLCQIGQLGRPMGRTILVKEFVEPLTATWQAAAACMPVEWAIPDACTCPGLEGMSVGTTVFHAVLAAVVLVLTPAVIICLLVQLVFFPSYRKGCNRDEALINAGDSKEQEIEDWLELREQKLTEAGTTMRQLIAQDLCPCTAARAAYQTLPTGQPMSSDS